MPIADKCHETDYGSTDSSDPDCRTVDVDRTSTFCRKWFTLRHTGRLAPDLCLISILCARNFANNLRTVRSLLVPAPYALWTLTTVAATECLRKKLC
ncbi:hypothetical protein TNCT_654751 [Trichonephila clavata]|uniref:Uncharacterized protein n=1 Tax=Trichonephila clavata TaxID=2740835 RepID=A0A8X6G1Q2_TRICU|nr:hypothetical protein TNCT_654751 [Trichonephila clavata]